MNQIRVAQCGGTVFALGQLFDPNDLVDPMTLDNLAERAMHQFDGLAIADACNDDVTDRTLRK